MTYLFSSPLKTINLLRCLRLSDIKYVRVISYCVCVLRLMVFNQSLLSVVVSYLESFTRHTILLAVFILFVIYLWQYMVFVSSGETVYIDIHDLNFRRVRVAVLFLSMFLSIEFCNFYDSVVYCCSFHYRPNFYFNSFIISTINHGISYFFI